MSATCLRVLIVEDEALIAMMAEDMVDSLGHMHVATAATLVEAKKAIAELDFDAALLDVNLSGDNSMELAALLKERGRPFAFTTGYGAGGIDLEHRDCPVLTKPYSLAELETTLMAFVDQATIRT